MDTLKEQVLIKLGKNCQEAVILVPKAVFSNYNFYNIVTLNIK